MEVFSESSHFIEAHLYVVVEVREIQSSASFEWCLDEELIELWWADLMFEGPHDNNFGRVSPVQWWSPPVRRDHGGRILRSQCTLLGWWEFWIVGLIHHECWKTLRYSVICVSFLSVFMCLSVIFVSLSSVLMCLSQSYFLLASTVAWTTRNYSSDLLSILLSHFGILNLEVCRVVLYVADGC